MAVCIHQLQTDPSSHTWLIRGVWQRGSHPLVRLFCRIWWNLSVWGEACLFGEPLYGSKSLRNTTCTACLSVVHIFIYVVEMFVCLIQTFLGRGVSSPRVMWWEISIPGDFCRDVSAAPDLPLSQQLAHTCWVQLTDPVSAQHPAASHHWSQPVCVCVPSRTAVLVNQQHVSASWLSQICSMVTGFETCTSVRADKLIVVQGPHTQPGLVWSGPATTLMCFPLF